MAKEQYISINTVIDRIYRHPLLQEITKESIIDYTVDFMRIVGVPEIFEEKVDTIKLSNYRASLPCEVIKVNSVRGKKYNCNYTYSSSVYHHSNNKNECRHEYKIQGNIIFATQKDEELEVSYITIKTDDNGIPMIPDNASFIRALESYIKKQYFTILFDMQQIPPQVLQNAQQEYYWAVGDCETEFKRMNLDEAESFYKMWRSMIVNNKINK